MKKFTKIMSLVLALVMMLSLAACGGETGTDATEPSNEAVEYVYKFADLVDNYDELSSAIYEEVLGEFLSTYEAAYEAETISERFALMAIAEAKLLESGALLPMLTAGGNYAISRAVPYSSTSVMWGIRPTPESLTFTAKWGEVVLKRTRPPEVWRLSQRTPSLVASATGWGMRW